MLQSDLNYWFVRLLIAWASLLDDTIPLIKASSLVARGTIDVRPFIMDGTRPIMLDHAVCNQEPRFRSFYPSSQKGKSAQLSSTTLARSQRLPRGLDSTTRLYNTNDSSPFPHSPLHSSVSDKACLSSSFSHSLFVDNSSLHIQDALSSPEKRHRCSDFLPFPFIHHGSGCSCACYSNRSLSCVCSANSRSRSLPILPCFCPLCAGDGTSRIRHSTKQVCLTL